MSEGLSSTSFCRIASALRYSASASAGLPVSDSRMPRLKWLSARRLRNSVTAGLSSASFAGSPAPAVLGLRLRRLARADSRMPRLLWLSARPCGIGDGGVVVGQLPLDRQRLAVLGLRLRRLARVRQQEAEVEWLPPGRCGSR